MTIVRYNGAASNMFIRVFTFRRIPTYFLAWVASPNVALLFSDPERDGIPCGSTFFGPRTRWYPRIRQLIQDHGATPNIPPKSNRRWKPCFSRRLYRERNLIERFFSKLKHFRRVATRYDKLAANFLAMVQLASMRLWMRANEPTV